MDREKRILELEKTLAAANKELQELKQPLNLLDLKNGDWIHLETLGAKFVLKYKQVDGLKGGAYLAYQTNRDVISSKSDFYENNDDFFHFNDANQKFRCASREEIHDALLKFADHKGYKKGTKYQPIGAKPEGSLNKSYRIFSEAYVTSLSTIILGEEHIVHCWGTEGFIYFDGQWAEIIEDYKEYKNGDWIYLKNKITDSYKVFRYKKQNLTFRPGFLGADIGTYTDSEKEFCFAIDEIFDIKDYEYRKATHDEIKDALRKIAKHKGFVDGAQYKPLIPTGIYTDLSLQVKTVKYFADCISCRFTGGKYYLFSKEEDGYIYYDGQWAEISADWNIKDGEWIKIRMGGCDYVAKYKYIDGQVGGVYMAVNKTLNEKIYENDDYFFHFGDNVRIIAVTEHDVREALFSVAVHKNLRTGAKFKPLPFGSAHPSNISKIQNVGFDSQTYDLYISGTGYIYDNKRNQWAELVKQFEIVPGYPVKYPDNEHCIINGIQYHKREIQELLAAIESINFGDKQIVIHSLNVGCSGQFKITTKDLKSILSNWKVQDEEEFAPRIKMAARYGLNKFGGR